MGNGRVRAAPEPRACRGQAEVELYGMLVSDLQNSHQRPDLTCEVHLMMKPQLTVPRMLVAPAPGNYPEAWTLSSSYLRALLK